MARVSQCSLALAAVLLAAQTSPVHAITGGVSVEEVLAARDGERYTSEQIGIARAVSAVTVALRRDDVAGSDGIFCSASIVHPRVVLTAAHCALLVRDHLQRIAVHFEGSASQRKLLDVIIHPGFLKRIKKKIGAYNPGTRNPKQQRVEIDFTGMAMDFALVLLHREIPETHHVVRPVAPDFRDKRTVMKVVAGYGLVDGSRSPQKLSLHFAELLGNSRLDEGIITGENEILMESQYRDGALINVCRGDSGGPVFVVDRRTFALRQLAVTSAGDERCRIAGVYSSIDRQRAVLRNMFDELMEGEKGADQNPF